MGYELHIIVAFTILSLVVGAAWVGGYLDAYQSKAQEVVLDKMGENKASYGLKSAITGQRVTEDEDVNKLQDEVGKDAGGVVGKGGIGEGVGNALSKGL
ncbi:hypothetical protein OEA41_001049 [Lepraria neglecta]|uniref:Uncharacterized protein n=1 Tax=Lepraria neglecta TaxID=209136 RepID=A0AAD9ZJL5_9LECA|nr:hypothetical protein OEA41_001049 [Lepraria neglecta]